MSVRLWRGPPLRQVLAGGFALALMVVGVGLAQRALHLDAKSYQAFERSAAVSELTLAIQQQTSDLRAWQATLLLEVLRHPAASPVGDHLDLARLHRSVDRIAVLLAELARAAPERREVGTLREMLEEIDAASLHGFEQLALAPRDRSVIARKLVEINAPLFTEFEQRLAELVTQLRGETRLRLARAQASNASAQAALIGVSLAALAIATFMGLMAQRARRHNAQLLRQLETLVEEDALTRMVNRRGLDRRLPRELSRAAREQIPLTLVMIDLDHFKRFNDLRGHAAGDSLLRELATAWLPELRAGDLLARYGGEEFTLVLPNTVATPTTALVERLRARVPAGQTFSAGIAAWDGQESAAALLARADAALLTAKRSGRRCSVLAKPSASAA